MLCNNKAGLCDGVPVICKQCHSFGLMTYPRKSSQIAVLHFVSENDCASLFSFDLCVFKEFILYYNHFLTTFSPLCIWADTEVLQEAGVVLRVARPHPMGQEHLGHGGHLCAHHGGDRRHGEAKDTEIHPHEPVLLTGASLCSCRPPCPPLFSHVSLPVALCNKCLTSRSQWGPLLCFSCLPHRLQANLTAPSSPHPLTHTRTHTYIQTHLPSPGRDCLFHTLLP